jgi:hypothetical protein
MATRSRIRVWIGSVASDDHERLDFGHAPLSASPTRSLTEAATANFGD